MQTIVGLAENSSCSTAMMGGAGAATLTLSDFDIVAEWPAIPRQKVSVIFSKVGEQSIVDAPIVDCTARASHGTEKASI